MTQYFGGKGGTITPTAGGQVIVTNPGTVANISVNNTGAGSAEVVVTSSGKNGTRVDIVGVNSLFTVYSVPFDFISVAGSGAAFAIDVSYPERIPPQFLSIAGSSDVTIIGSSGSTNQLSSSLVSFPGSYGPIFTITNTSAGDIWTSDTLTLVILDQSGGSGSVFSIDVSKGLLTGIDPSFWGGTFGTSNGQKVRVFLSSNAGAVGFDSQANTIALMAQPLRLLPGESLIVQGQAVSGGGNVSLQFDYESTPE